MGICDFYTFISYSGESHLST